MRKRIITILVIVAVVLLAALPKLDILKGGEEKAPAAGASTNLPVEALILKTAALDNKVIVTGSILSNESLELKSEVSGKITLINFREGSIVKRGDLLVQINDEEIRAQLEK